MIGEAVITGVINGFFERHQVEKWARLILSCGVSAFCTGTGVMGAGVIAHLSAGTRPGVAMAYGFGEGLVASAALVLHLWIKSPLTKGMPIAVPGSVEAAEIKILENEGIVSYENKK
jgi:hypothetical protein